MRHEQVRGERRGAHVGGVVVQDLVVDLVREQDQVVPAGQLDDLLQRRSPVHGPGRVVRVDDDDRLGPGRDLRRQVGQVGLPVVGLVAQVVHGVAAAQRDRGRPQGIVRHRHEDLVAVVQQRLQRQHDQLGDAVAEPDVLDVDPVDALVLVVLHHRAAGRQQALGVAVPVGLRQVEDDVLQHLGGCLEAERGRVADVELEHMLALGLHPLRFLQHRAADVVADIGQLRRLGDVHAANLKTGARRPTGHIRSRFRLMGCRPVLCGASHSVQRPRKLG